MPSPSKIRLSLTVVMDSPMLEELLSRLFWVIWVNVLRVSSYGKGGSVHMFAPGFYGGNGTVGAQVPLSRIGFRPSTKKVEKNATFDLYDLSC